ncbi:hypothetical protein [Kitasatospora cineracea]|uniref:REDY-like protein HapK n=1 Tax=Kitasatospora cineracea TaxID=88074 RepID=A0A3N4RE95_9ACTN|nr:hypothetical protein [Kitasatospora cineracea]ROR37526.1 hypothetical protein EDD39_5675 [Kitasatospora cineracea]RPE29031.1 hypothetical protein EDD38_6177 [Kitasatospora cineracea]
MKLIAVMVRTLNAGVDYQEFRRAWAPDEVVPDDPRVVLSALNLEDPQELCTVAVIEDVEPADIPVWMERLAPIEERRYQRIRHLVSEPRLNAVYRVVAEDALAHPVAA